MTISFSGLASGLDTSSWVESLVALKQAKVETLEEEKETVMLSQETLNNIKSFFNSFRSVIEKVTDAKFGSATTDLFAQNLANSTNLDVLTASATPEAEKGTYNVLVDKLASETQANSTYSYMTTIIQTTTATNDSKLINLGVNAGNIGVNVNGVERRISITETDTIGTFVEKLKNIGVEASYNEETGVFSLNTDDGAINDIDGTGIVSALHLSGVNEGYTSNSLKVSTTDTVYSAATEATLLKDLGVQAGVITVHANDTNYNISIYNTSTLGSFISDLHSNNVDAELDSTGVFTISDAEITNEGTTDILNALGLAVDIYGKSQITGDLYHSSVVTQTTTATSSTLLKSLGEGISISNGQTVIVKNSNNEYTTITVGTTTTLGGLLEAMSNAGLYAALQNDGTVEIAGGTITGGTFDAISALGLLTEPYSAMVTGNSLTETVEVHQLVTLQTKLVDDLKVSEGYLEVTDADNNKEYLKIYSGQTIADLMTALANYGLSTSLDEETGVLTITGGAFQTLSDADVQALVSNGTIRETESRYIKGTNLLECLYGAGTISTEHITVSSTYARSRALTYSVTNTINASLTTTLSNLGLSNGSAVFDVRGESRTITLNNTISIQGLMDALTEQGIASSWDSDNSRITIENATLVGGTSNLADVLDLTTTVSGKYVTSNELYSRETLTIDATRNTVLKDYGISNTMSEAERTVNLYNSDGTLLASTVVGEGTTIGNLLDWINSSTGVSASLKNGIITLNNGYIENSALETSMGLTTSNKSSYVLGSIMSVTTTAAVTGETTLGDIISTLGTTAEVSGGYNLVFNSNSLSVSATTTINELINMIYVNGGTAFLDHTGRLSINGGTLSGSVAQALGVTSVTHTSSVSASGETLYTKEEVYADLDTTLSDLGISDTSYIIYNSLGQSYKTVNISSTSTLGTFLNGLKSEGIDGTISNGVIKLESAEGKYISGALATSLGITTQTTTEIVNTTQSSTLAITHTGTVVADENSTLGDIGAITAENQTLNIFNKEQSQIGSITILTSTSTVGDLFAALKDYGIVGTITNGVISLYSEAGNYVSGDIATNLGIGVENGINKTYTVAQTITSSDRITYSNNVDATESSKLAEFIPDLSSINVVVYNSSSTNIGTITIDTSTTIGDFLANLSNYDITGNIEDGVISLTSNVGNYISDTTLKQYLGIDTTSVIVTMTSGATTTSTAQITYTEVRALTGETKLSDVGVHIGTTTGVEGTDPLGLFVQSSTGEMLGEINLAENATVNDMLLALAGYGISGTVQDGKIVLNSTNGNYIVGSIATELGIDSVATTATMTVGTSATSTAAITYTETVLATDTTRLDEIFKPYVIDGTITSTGVTGTVIGISSAQELEWLANLVNDGDDMTGKTFVLTDNIDLSGYSNWTPIGGIDYTSSIFRGKFDGQGYTISNLTQSIVVTDTDYNVGGLFGYVEGVISNLKLNAFNIYMENTESSGCGAGVGALVGFGDAISINGVSANNITITLGGGTDIDAGGIIGSGIDGTNISNCSTNGYIVNYGSSNSMGGIVGNLSAYSDSIIQCHSSMSLQSQTDYDGYNGGIVGNILHTETSRHYVRIMDCSFSGRLYSTNVDYIGVGGIVGALINYRGETVLNIANCYAQLQYLDNYDARAILGYADISNGSAYITLKDSYGYCKTGAYFEKLCYNTGNAYYTYDYSVGDFNEEYLSDLPDFWQVALASGYDTSIWNSDGTVKTVMDNTLMVVDGDDGSAEMLELTPDYISNHTLGDLTNWIESQTGSPVNIIDGVIKIADNTENKYVAGPVAEDLGIEIDTSQVKTVGVANTSTVTVTYTTTRTAATTDSLMSLKYTINGTITSTGVTGTVIGISSAQELEWLADIVNRGNDMSGKTFVLLNDIDMSGITDWTPIGDGTYTYKDFAGTFDGLGHTIRNLTMTSINPSATGSFPGMGLFGLLTGNAKIMNLNLDNFNFSNNTDPSNDCVGFLAIGTTYGSQYISGVNVTNSTISCNGGGLLGFTSFGSSDSITIINCSTQFTATAYFDDDTVYSGGFVGRVGGIVGLAYYNTYIKGCSSSFTADGSYYYAGGIMGRAYAYNGANFTIEDCTYKGSITTTRDVIRGISGIIGNYCISNNDTTSSVTINRVYSDANLNINSANVTNVQPAGIIGIAEDVDFDITQTNNVVNLTDCYNSQSYDSYYLENSVYATVNSSNIRSRVTNSQMGIIVGARGFDLNLWDRNNGSLKIVNEYGIVVSKSNGASLATISLNGTNSIQDMLNELNNYGSADIMNGQILFTPFSDNYLSGGFADVYSMTDNLSDELKVSDTDILKEDTLISRNSVIKLISQGVEYTITVPSKETVGGMLTQLAAYGIEGKVSNGKITLIGNENSYITYMDSSLKAYLKLSNQWSSLKSITTNTDSDTLNIVSTNTAISNTTLDSLQLSGDYYITLKVEGTTQILTINSSQTLGDVFTELAAYDIRSSIQNGLVTFVGTDDAYIEGMTVDLDKALKLYGVDKHTTKTETTYANTDSDTLNSSILMSLTTSTHLSDLNVGANGYITLMADGTQYTMTITPDMSIDDIISTLAGYGISGSVHDAQLTLVGRDDNYILSISDNIANALNLTQGKDHTYISTEESYYQNTDSNYLSSTETITLTTSSTFADIGLSNESYITVMTNGTEHVVTVTSDKTIDDLISTIAGFGISGSVNDGKLTFAANNGCYIKDMTSSLKELLKLTLGQGHSWTTIEGATWVNTDSNDLGVEKNDLKLTGDTVLSSINGFDNGNGSLIVHQTNGSYVTISVDASKTLDEFFEQISYYGLVGSIDSSGKVTITGVGNAYLQAASGGSNILTALKLGNLVQNVQTVTVNRTSDTLTHTVTVAASGTTILENLGDSAGNSIEFDASNKAYIILETYSDAGNTHVTLNFSKTQSIYDVIDTLAEYGINASIDAKGRFSVSSPTLTDFDMSGSLGTFLMGTYDKKYGTDTTYNVTTNLVQKTIVNMDDFSKLSSFGVTNGNILITQQGVTYTVNIDTTSITTIGEFRNLLSRYGFTSSIDNMGRLSVSGIGNSYLSSIASGSNILELLGLTNWTLGEITQSSSYLTDTEAKINRISMSDKLSDLTNASGTSLGITDGQIYVYQDGTRSTLNINTNDTLETLAAKLSQYGISVGISQEGKLYFDGNNNSYLTTDGIATSSASNILSRIGIAGNWSTRYDSTSGNLQYTEDVDNVMTGSTKLSDLQDSSGNNLGITEGSYYVYSNGVRNTETITSDMTVNDFMATMAKYGLNAEVAEDGSISVGAYNNTYLATSALSGQNSNIVSTLFAEWDFVNIYTSNGLDVPVDEIRAINRNTKLADINEGSYEDGNITVIKDGVQTNISLSAEDTVGTLMDELALYGFESVINDNGQLIIKNSGDSLLQNYTGSDKKSNVLSLLGIGLNDWISTNTYHSSTLDVVSTSTISVSATRTTLLSELGVSTGEYYIYNNGVKYTAMISSDETVGSLMDTLKNFGLETSLVSGVNGAVLSIIGKGDSYVAKSSSTTNSSNVVEQLFTGGIKESKEYSGLEQTTKIETTISAATEDTLLSYYDNASLKAEGNLSITVNDETSIIKITSDETIGSLLEKFKALGLEATISNGQIMVQSGYDTMTINTDGTTSNLLSNIGLVYQNDLGGYIASNNTVKSTTTSIEEKTLSVANYADMETQLKTLNISDGFLTVYVDGKKGIVEINADETFKNLQERLSTAFSDLTLNFKDGYLTIYSTAGKSVEIGSTTDKGNFSAITGISKDENGVIKSSRALYRVNSDSLITTSGLFRKDDVTEGTFIVGNATFTIDANTKLSDLISQINASEEANATAYWDNIDGKFVIKSRTTGAAYINIEAGTSNFTDIMGYTTSSWKANGNIDVTRININSQEIGNNAKLSINGTTYTSTSNTITSDVSRIKGLTVNLKGLTEGSAVTLTVERDKETLANAVSEVVDSYNELMKNVDEAIAIDGQLHDETTLKLIRNQLRNLMTSSDVGTTIFRNLDSIGISVAKANGSNISTSSDSIINLSFDKDNFFKAYESDEDAVKALLVGGTSNTGIFTSVETLIESTLQAVTGYFSATDRSYSNKVDKLERKIVKANEDIERYRARLEAKFSAMDMLIANMQQQYSSFLVT